ncbi:RNA transcription, translation and transport factor protein-like isoform X1 [Oncorhynchus nerka]|uniref:RNA transcription, translation and transport factor protein-like isoform X1 n=1 Tax=Oncorhynchus nerka TaxID=8023 RepID=UPI00113283E7|nr:RNA transcription, translation and transport factor protein-like isoform X1 [Oncorhynchus nerka]
MFRRKLTALDYHNPSGFDCKDETEFRNFIVWLEDQKIRHYKIEERGNLRNIPSSGWPKSFEQYLQDVNCPFTVEERQESVDWLLGLAVRLEYGDNGSPVEKYKNCPLATATEAAKPSDPLIHLDSSNPDFKAGVLGLASLLKIQRHDDYLVMLKAIRILIQERLTPEAIAKASQSKEGLPVALDKHILGFDTGGLLGWVWPSHCVKICSRSVGDTSAQRKQGMERVIVETTVVLPVKVAVHLAGCRRILWHVI